MQQMCHTCGAELAAASGETPFCPQCGAPQLTLDLDLQTPVAPVPGDATTGSLPPPRPQQVDWRLAIRCAAAVAAIGAALSLGALRIPVLTPATVLWMMSGSLVTLGLYQNRRPAAWMDARVGARIGLMVGLCLAVGLAVPMAAAGLIARFGLHAMGSFDVEMTALFQKVVQQSAQQSGAPFPPEALRLIGSQEFRAAYVLFSAAITAAVLLVLSAIGGAFGGLLRTRHKTPV